jgi:hypothetical protein
MCLEAQFRDICMEAPEGAQYTDGDCVMHLRQLLDAAWLDGHDAFLVYQINLVSCCTGCSETLDAASTCARCEPHVCGQCTNYALISQC